MREATRGNAPSQTYVCVPDQVALAIHEHAFCRNTFDQANPRNHVFSAYLFLFRFMYVGASNCAFWCVALLTVCPFEWCLAQSKCPAGKYTKTAGTPASQPECDVCATGSFKAFMSGTSTETDSCIIHTKCPPGKYTKTVGSITTQPKCEVCETGYFKAYTSNSSIENDSCDTHTKCPPGKYTAIAGSIYAEPRCETCAVGFFKAFTSRSSMCAGTASRPGTRVG